MGSVQVVDLHEHQRQSNGSIGISNEGQFDGNGFASVKISGLAADNLTTPTGMKDEILLLSWLIVLLRTREAGQISFDWAYKIPANGIKHEPLIKSLSMGDVIGDLQSRTGEVAAVISHHIKTAASSQSAARHRPALLLLSTASLSQASNEGNGEVSQCFILANG
jgi:hypothetical protein